MSYIWFLVHLSAEQGPKSAKYQFTNFARDSKEGAKINLKLFFATLKRILRKKPKSIKKERKTEETTYI